LVSPSVDLQKESTLGVLSSMRMVFFSAPAELMLPRGPSTSSIMVTLKWFASTWDVRLKT
jgi:hypothetical protein